MQLASIYIGEGGEKMKTLEKSKLQLMVVIGHNKEGDNVTKAINFNQLAPDVSDDNATAVGEALGELQNLEVDEIRRIDDSLLA